MGFLGVSDRNILGWFIKLSLIRFRSFDPIEQARLSAHEALDEVQKSVAVVVSLLSERSPDFAHNNFRGAFLSGLAYGLDKIILLLQEGEEPVPPDYIELVSIYIAVPRLVRYSNNNV
jgi:hypothetical protein